MTAVGKRAYSKVIYNNYVLSVNCEQDRKCLASKTFQQPGKSGKVVSGLGSIYSYLAMT